jgi:hypothetical protein
MQGLSNQIVECLLLRAIVVERHGCPQPKGVFLTKKMGLVEVVPMFKVDSILALKPKTLAILRWLCIRLGFGSKWIIWSLGVWHATISLD